MATITANTKHVVKVAKPAGTTTAPTGAKKSVASISGKPAAAPAGGAAGGRRGAVAPPLKPSSMNVWSDWQKQLLAATAASDSTSSDNNNDDVTTIQLKQQQFQLERIHDLFRRVLGEHTTFQVNKPHAASTTRDRGMAAADLATITKHIGLPYVLNQCGILNELQRTMFPDGIESIMTRGGGGTGLLDQNNSMADDTASNAGNSNDGTTTGLGLKPSASAVSLASMGSMIDTMTITTNDQGGANTVDSFQRGKTTPPNAREGCLLLLRALIEIIGKPCEPYLVGAFLVAALDECASSSSTVREAADDTSVAIVSIANPYSFKPVLAPILLQSLRCPEWRTKAAALERLAQCATSIAPAQVYPFIPTLVPALTNQVWDTKAQVSKSARTALLAICNTNTNPDIKPTIPYLVNAICKPADTNKAMSELMGTTFVVPVDASVLSILCPLLARALKEKLAIHKRAACIVINNMSKLVRTPNDIAPFGSLLVPELQKVMDNVQFTEIQVEATKAFTSLTKALGDQYQSKATNAPPPLTSITTS